MTTYIEEVHKLKTLAVGSVRTFVDLTALSLSEVDKTFFSFVKVHTCSACKGNLNGCRRCYGTGLSRTKTNPTLQDITARFSKINTFVKQLQKVIDKNAAKALLLQQQAQEQQKIIEERKQEFLNSLSASDRTDLLDAFKQAEKPFEVSITVNFQRFGTLSAAQLENMLRIFREKKHLSKARNFFDIYKKGDNDVFILKIDSILENIVVTYEHSQYYNSDRAVTRIKCVNTANQIFMIDTGSKTLIELFKSFPHDVWFKLNGTVTWVADTDDKIRLSPKDLKFVK